jgi:hypothetical protein
VGGEFRVELGSIMGGMLRSSSNGLYEALVNMERKMRRKRMGRMGN